MDSAHAGIGGIAPAVFATNALADLDTCSLATAMKGCGHQHRVTQRSDRVEAAALSTFVASSGRSLPGSVAWQGAHGPAKESETTRRRDMAGGVGFVSGDVVLLQVVVTCGVGCVAVWFG